MAMITILHHMVEVATVVPLKGLPTPNLHQGAIPATCLAWTKPLLMPAMTTTI